MPIPIRSDFDARQLRVFARKTKDGPQARRLLALAAQDHAPLGQAWDASFCAARPEDGVRLYFRPVLPRRRERRWACPPLLQHFQFPTIFPPRTAPKPMSVRRDNPRQ